MPGCGCSLCGRGCRGPRPGTCGRGGRWAGPVMHLPSGPSPWPPGGSVAPPSWALPAPRDLSGLWRPTGPLRWQKLRVFTTLPFRGVRAPGAGAHIAQGCEPGGPKPLHSWPSLGVRGARGPRFLKLPGHQRWELATLGPSASRGLSSASSHLVAASSVPLSFQICVPHNCPWLSRKFQGRQS